MLGFSTADGFMNVKEGIDEMIKHIANEPSVGLYYVQRHAHSSMPYLLDIRNKVAEKANEVALHTEDIEDSIYAVRSMTECGFPIADDMIKDINKSLRIMSSSQPKRGLITPSTPTYFSSVINSAKKKAAGMKWPKGEQFFPYSESDIEAEELPVSSSLNDGNRDTIGALHNELLENVDKSFLLEHYDKFRVDKEAKFEEWLRDEQ